VEGEENNMKDSENEDETENEGNTTPFSRRKNRVRNNLFFSVYKL